MPSINRTEFNEMVVIEKLVWISKESFLPVKYHRLMSFKMTPYVIGALESETSFDEDVQSIGVSGECLHRIREHRDLLRLQ